MPQPPSEVRILPAAVDDLNEIKTHNPDHAERCFDRIDDWERKIQWGRVPQDHLTFLSGSSSYNFYREWVGRSNYRIIYEISEGVMTVVAVLPKGDRTYELAEFKRRMEKL